MLQGLLWRQPQQQQLLVWEDFNNKNVSKVCARRRFWWTLFWSLFTSVPHRKNLEQGYTNFIYKTFAFRIPWKKPQLFTGRIYPPSTEILFPTTNIKFLRLVVLAVGNKTSWLQKSSKYINRLEGLVSFSCVRNLIYKNTWSSPPKLKSSSLQ